MLDLYCQVNRQALKRLTIQPGHDEASEFTRLQDRIHRQLRSRTLTLNNFVRARDAPWRSLAEIQPRYNGYIQGLLKAQPGEMVDWLNQIHDLGVVCYFTVRQGANLTEGRDGSRVYYLEALANPPALTLAYRRWLCRLWHLPLELANRYRAPKTTIPLTLEHDVFQYYNPLTLAQLLTTRPWLYWYLRHLKGPLTLTGEDVVILNHPPSFNPKPQRYYLLFHLLDHIVAGAADTWPRYYREHHWGRLPQRSWQQVRMAAELMGAEASQSYRELRGANWPEDEQAVRATLEALKSHYWDLVQTQNLQPSTLKFIQQKLKLLRVNLGFDERGISSKEKPQASFQFWDQWWAYGHKRQRARNLANTGGQGWLVLQPFEVNACYDPQDNTITIPAAIINRPFWGYSDPLRNWAGLGRILAHELMHAFDSEGIWMNGEGQFCFKNWYHPQDWRRRQRYHRKIIRLYENHGENGRLTLTENLADIMALKLVLTFIPAKKQARLLKLMARNRITKIRRQAQDNYQDDEHSSSRLRTNLPLIFIEPT